MPLSSKCKGDLCDFRFLSLCFSSDISGSYNCAQEQQLVLSRCPILRFPFSVMPVSLTTISLIFSLFSLRSFHTVAHICKHNKQFLKHSTIFLKHNTKLSKHNTILSKHNTKLSKHNTILSKHNTKLSKKNTILSKHNTTLSKHNIKLPKHNTKLSKHNTKITETQSYMLLYNVQSYH